MSDNRNYGDSPRPDIDNFHVNFDDESFSDPDETLSSINGSQRIKFTPDVLEEDYDELNPYVDDSREKSDKKEHKKRDKIKSHKNKRIFRLMWLLMVILVGLSISTYLIGGSNDFLAVTRKEGTTTVLIPDNVTSTQLADILDSAGAIDEPEFFKLYCDLTTKMEYFESGTYELSTNMDYEAIINKLQAGDTEVQTVTITFQEGMTAREIAERLEENGVVSADEFLEACNSDAYDKYDMIGYLGTGEGKYYKLEGYLFPDTYTFYVDDDIDSVIGKFLYNYQKRVTSDIVTKIENSNYTMDQIITIASLIQAEAANTEDMYMISAIIYNRLETGMYYEIYNLGMDSTVYYPYSDSEDAPEGFESSYDTYTITGLPAGAICNPGIDAIRAAVNPNSAGAYYYYFCHDSEGKPYYASSYWEHQQNLVTAGLA